MRTLDVTLTGSLQPLADFSWVWRWAQQMRLMPASSFRSVDAASIELLLDALVDYGLPELFLRRFQVRSRARCSALFWSEVRGAILLSPLPGVLAWSPLRELLDDAELMPMIGVRPTSLWRYVSGRRPTPPQTLAQLHALNTLLCDLSLQLSEAAARTWLKSDQSAWLAAATGALEGEGPEAAVAACEPLIPLQQMFRPLAERHPGYPALLAAVSAPGAFAAPLPSSLHSGAIEGLLRAVTPPARGARQVPLLLETA